MGWVLRRNYAGTSLCSDFLPIREVADVIDVDARLACLVAKINYDDNMLIRAESPSLVRLVATVSLQICCRNRLRTGVDSLL